MNPLQTVIVEHSPSCRLTVVMLHGYAMSPQDLLPFAHSLGIAAVRFVVPTGPVDQPPGLHSWWPLNLRQRQRALASGPRDAANEHPTGREAAREALAQLLDDLEHRHGALGSVVLLGFSQGGMLACDFVLHEPRRIDGLVLLSSSRVAFDEWQPRLPRVRGLPVLVAHGHDDADLAFRAGEALRDCLVQAGACVQWVPFEGGHETPLPVWRQVRKFLTSMVCQPGDTGPSSPQTGG